MSLPSSLTIASSTPTVPCHRNLHWNNWGKTAHCQPEYPFFSRSARSRLVSLRLQCTRAFKDRRYGAE
jgi:hypothetical protein